MTRITVFIAAVLLAAPAFGLTCTGLYCYEAENAQRISTLGTMVVNTITQGNSGTGYVTSFDNTNDRFEMDVIVPTGLHELRVGYRSQFGDKGYRYRVGSQTGTGTFNQSSTFTIDSAGLFNLTGGTQTLGITKDWGFHDVDFLQFVPFTPPEILPVSSQLSDELADDNTQALMNYLTSIYGQKTLAGHQHDESKNLPFPSSTYTNLSGGLKPAIRSSDFMEYSPSRIAFNADPRNESEESIAWAKSNGGIVSMTWHWNAPANLVNSSEYPWWRGFYTQGTTFDLAGSLANPSGSDYQLLLRDIDAIGVELQKFQDQGVPVIWRPLHEAQGNANGVSGNGAWFWWGADGPGAFKDLWRLMYNRLTTPRPEDDFPGLHNLIWEFTSSAAKTGHESWYPGDDVVDMIGLDIYTDPSSSMSGEWYDVLAHYNGPVPSERKMIALSESGTLPNADLMDTYGIKWSYFSLWKDGFLDDFTAQQVQTLLNDEDIITLNELPMMPWSDLAPAPGDYNNDGSVDVADYVLWRKLAGQSGTGLVADSNLDGRIDALDYAAWASQFGNTPESGSLSSETAPEPNMWLLACAASFHIWMWRQSHYNRH